MGLIDLIIGPVYLILFTVLAYLIRPYFTNQRTYKYFLPALWVRRFLGAIMLGILYKFYYSWGDTYSFYSQGMIIREALMHDFSTGLRLLFSNGEMDPNTYFYAERIYWYNSPSEFAIIRIIGALSLFAGGSYIAISLFSAFFSFAGSWLLYRIVENRFPAVSKWLAYAILFVPSTIFWGSGVLKDTLTTGAIGFAFWGANKIVVERKRFSRALIVLLLSCYLIFQLKIYILLCFIPSLFFWWYTENVRSIKSVKTKVILVPILSLVVAISGFFFLDQIASTSYRYNLNSLAEWSYITSYDIRFYTGKDAGSGYDLGVQDGTWQTLIKLAPAAINVSLFRPYIWEVKNPLMLLSAAESFVILLLTLRAFLRFSLAQARRLLKDPMILTFLIFSLTFAFAVGASTYNFGSLSRYKVPLLPFFLASIIIINFYPLNRSVSSKAI